MRVIVSWSLRYRLIVLGIAAVLMLAGYTLLSRASFDTLPEFGPPRVEVQTVPVAAADGGRVKVPSATVLFDQQGRTWVFTEPEHDVFVREPVTVIGTNGEDTILSTGPVADTPVVTVGVPELYGTELGVGDPE